MDLDIVVCHTNLNIDQSKLIRPVFDYLALSFDYMMVDATFPLSATSYLLFPVTSLPTLFSLPSPPLPPPPHPSVCGSAVPAGCGLEGSGPSLPSPRLQQQHQPQIQVMQQLWPHPPIDMCISDWPLTSQTLTPLSTDHWRPCEFKSTFL